MMRSGRTRSRMVIWPSPSTLGSRFQAHHVRLLQLQFGRVLAGHDALVVVDIAGQTIEQRRIAGADAARYKHIHLAAADHL